MSSEAESSSNAAINALRKRGYKEFRFIQEQMSDMIDKDLEQRQTNKKQKGKTAVTMTPAVIETDGVFVDDTNESVGSIIKRRAVELHSNFGSLSNDDYLTMCLGLNSILSLTQKHPHGQASAFTFDQWRNLFKRFRDPQKNKKNVSDFLRNKLRGIEKLATRELPAALRKCKLNEANEQRSENSFALFVYLQVLRLHSNHGYLFDPEVPKSEGDFLIKVWGPILESLFSGSGIRLKWGDTTGEFGLLTAVKVDLRFLTDIHVQGHQTEFDLSQAEFAKQDAGPQKFFHDHVKVLMEAKIVLDSITKCLHYHDQPSVHVMQIHGFDLYIYRLVIQAPGLYIATTTAKLVLPSTIRKLGDLWELIDALLTLKLQIVDLKEQLKEAKRNDRKGASLGTSIDSGSQEQEDPPSINSWIRDTWIPPNANRPLPPTPLNFCHSG